MGTGINPCCGIKLKTAVILIAIIDMVYGSIFLTFGIITIAVDSTPRALKQGLEIANLLGRPVFKILGGITLLVSAVFHMKRSGIPSIIGCATWILIQLCLFGLTSIRFLMYMTRTSDKDYPNHYLVRSGLSALEVLAVLSSILPFASIFVLWYEIVSVSFFAFKIFRDRHLLEEVERTLKDVQSEYEKTKSKTATTPTDETDLAGILTHFSVDHIRPNKKIKVKTVYSDSSVSATKHTVKANKRKK